VSFLCQNVTWKIARLRAHITEVELQTHTNNDVAFAYYNLCDFLFVCLTKHQSRFNVSWFRVTDLWKHSFILVLVTCPLTGAWMVPDMFSWSRNVLWVFTISGSKNVRINANVGMSSIYLGDELHKKTPIDPSLWVTHIEAPKTTSDVFSLTLHKIAIQTLKKLPLKTHLQEGQNLKLYSNMHPFLLISDKNCFSI